MVLFLAVVLSSVAWDSASATGSRHNGNGLRLVVFKHAQILELHDNGGKLKTFRICLGLTPFGPKTETGDRRTPEGEYFICMKNRTSKFHLFMGISYPGEHDAQSAFEKGRISRDTRDSIIEKVRNGQAPPWNTKLGGWVGIHGYPSGDNQHRWITLLYPKPHNWTDGCIALWNFEVEELFSHIPLGTPVTILP